MSKSRPSLIRRLFGLLALVALLLCAWRWRAPLLVGMARAWMVNEPVPHADAIVVLGGGLEDRPFVAAQFYHEGRARRILLAQPQLSPTAEMGLTQPEADVAWQVLRRKGVPDEAVQMIGSNVTSTLDEARAIKVWAQQNKPGTLLVPTDVFHTRRARWILQRTLKGTGVDVRVTAIEPRRYQSTNWWQHEDGLIAFQNEVVKFGYYLLKY